MPVKGVRLRPIALQNSDCSLGRTVFSFDPKPADR
jgi:hypothetical protein